MLCAFLVLTWLTVPSSVRFLPLPVPQAPKWKQPAPVLANTYADGLSCKDVSVTICIAPGSSCSIVFEGCERACHTYCANLDALPEGDWFCWVCMENRDRQLAGEEPVDTAGKDASMHMLYSQLESHCFYSIAISFHYSCATRSGACGLLLSCVARSCVVCS